MKRGEITVQQAAALSTYGEAYVVTLARRGKVRSRKARGRRLIDRKSFDGYIARQAGYDALLERAKSRLLDEVLTDFSALRRLACDAMAAGATL